MSTLFSTSRPRGRLLALAAASALALSILATVPVDSQASPAPARAQARTPAWEVWQVPERPYPQNRSNPLANRIWGVYDGPQDQVSAPYQRARGEQKELIAKIALRPRTKWYGAWVGDTQIRSSVEKYVAASQKGDPNALVQLAVFRMEPWEHEACKRPSTTKQRQSYRRWIKGLAAGIGTTPTLVVMQPDGPFLWCTPDRRAKAKLLSFATETLSALPRTSVYIDAGAADWCENDRGNAPERCAAILEATGIEHARGFALDSTHYTGPAENIRHGKRIVDILRSKGYATKRFIIDTAKSGRPMQWSEVVPSTKGGLKDNARTCATPAMRRCVTLGIPPTVRVADPRWGLAAAERRVAKRYVDGFVWFGRPWLHNQADPFVKKRALQMGRSTPWPGPRAGTPPNR